MHRVLQKAKTIHTFQICTGSSVIMPLEKQNTGQKKEEREKYTKEGEERGREGDRNDRLDSEEGQMERCSCLL